MISLQNKKIALIGGAGFIGHNLAIELKRLGADVSVIDGLQVNNLLYFSSSESNEYNRKLYISMLNQRLNLLQENDIPIFIQDCRDYHALSKLFAKISPEVVFHLAAVSHAGKSNKNPYSTFDHSLRTLENALDSSRHIEHFIYFSSSMVYGHFKGGFVTEETTCEPIGIYGALKFCGEKLVIAYNQVFGLPYTIIRPSALYGERCVSRRVGQIFIENAIKDEKVTISGDGNDRLDFTYIKDLIQGLVKVIKNPNAKNKIFNLTYGQSRSLNDLVSILKEFFPSINIEYTNKDKLLPDRGTLSVDLASRLIDYQPEYPIEKGFVEYIQWYKDLFSRKKYIFGK